jgi:hypothetical protein
VIEDFLVRPEFRRVIVLLLGGALFLPIAIALIVTVARLLAALGDAAGALAFDRLGLGLGVTWVLSLIALVVCLALQTLARHGDSDDEGE